MSRTGATAGNPPLAYAIAQGQTAVVELLVDKGADLSAIDKDSVQSMLCYTIDRGYARMTEVLLTHGADPNARDGAGVLPLQIAARTGNLETMRLLLDRVRGVGRPQQRRARRPSMRRLPCVPARRSSGF